MVGFLDRNAGRVLAALLISLAINAFLAGVAVTDRGPVPPVAPLPSPGPIAGPGAAMADVAPPFAGIDGPAGPRLGLPHPPEGMGGSRGEMNEFPPESTDFDGEEALP